MSDQHVTFDRDGHVAILTISNPPLNLINVDVMEGLNDALRRIQDESELRAIVLTGEGDRAFCAGVDLDEEASGSSRTSADGEPDRLLYDTVQRVGIPVVAAIAGHCIGGGFELALACDIRIAAYDAQFCAAGVKVGLVVSATRLGTWFSPAVASDLVLTGRTIDGREAERLNIVSRAVARGDVVKEARDWAATIAERAPLAVMGAKRAIRQTVERGFDAALAEEAAASSRLMKSDDHMRALEAFFKRERPEFKGR